MKSKAPLGTFLETWKCINKFIWGQYSDLIRENEEKKSERISKVK